MTKQLLFEDGVEPEPLVPGLVVVAQLIDNRLLLGSQVVLLGKRRGLAVGFLVLLVHS